MNTPLNPGLYAMLVRIFGEVRVANGGEPFRGRLVKDILGKGYTRVVGDVGEYYCVCCPRCGDSRFRLWINHRWGTRLQGEKLSHLFVCYNEHCEEDGRLRRWLEERTAPYVARGLGTAVKAVKPSTGLPSLEPPAISIPESTPLHLLDRDHPVLVWLRSRGFDPRELGESFDVRWGKPGPSLPRCNRLIFPIYAFNREKQLEAYGFQARFFEPHTLRTSPQKSDRWGRKWHTATGTKVTRLLYNGWRCAGSRLVIIGEGPLDVIRAGGDCAVATFGKSVSGRQQEMLWAGWGRKGAVGVLAFDEDAWRERKDSRSARKLREMLERMRGAWRGAIRLRFPVGEDPGSTRREVLYGMIVEELQRIQHASAKDVAEALDVVLEKKGAVR